MATILSKIDELTDWLKEKNHKTVPDWVLMPNDLSGMHISGKLREIPFLTTADAEEADQVIYEAAEALDLAHYEWLLNQKTIIKLLEQLDEY